MFWRKEESRRDEICRLCLLASEAVEEGLALGSELCAAATALAAAAAVVGGGIVVDGRLELGLLGSGGLIGTGAEDVGSATTAVVSGVGGGAANGGLDVLAETGLVGVAVLEHVAAAAAAGGDDCRLEGGGLEVLGGDLVELGGVSVVAGTAASVGDKHFEGFVVERGLLLV